MQRYSAGIDIEAAPEAVWAVLADLEQWPQFDPHTERVEGRAAPGASITVYSTLAPGRAFPLKVTAFEAPRQMAWTGGLPLGMLMNVRTHTISAQGAGSRLEVEEVISGPMAGAVASSLPDLNAVFADFCQGLKARAEAPR
jgi:hypothetical protein